MVHSMRKCMTHIIDICEVLLIHPCLEDGAVVYLVFIILRLLLYQTVSDLSSSCLNGLYIVSI